MKQELISVALAFVLIGLAAPFLDACSADKTNAPPPSTGTAMGMDGDAGGGGGTMTHGAGW